MASGSIARRYAKALVSLGQDAGNLETLGADLDAFASVLALGDGTLRQALSNPGFTTIERKVVLNEVLGGLKLTPVMANFLRLLVDKNRFTVFAEIQRSFHDMADVLAGRVRATVSTAAELSDDMRSTVQNALDATTGKTVTIDFKVDPSLIGGMVAQVGDVSYDSSVQARLEDIQAALIRNPGVVAEA